MKTLLDCRTRALLVALSGLFLLVSGAKALDLAEALELGLERDAGLIALSARARAASARIVADSALADPEVFIAAEGLPIDDPLSADMMTMYAIGIRQSFPAGRTRTLRADQRRADVSALEQERRLRILDIRRQLSLAWVEWVSAEERRRVVEQGLAVFEELAELAQSRFRSGGARQQDLEQARLELAMRQRALIDAELAVATESAALMRWTGQAPGARVPSLPEWSMPPRVNALIERSRSHPVFAVDEANVLGGQVSTQLIRQSYRPMWMIEAGYGHQRGRDPMGMGRQSDRLFAMVSFSLPLFTGNRQDREMAAAEAELDALIADQRLRWQQWEGDIRSQHRRAEGLLRRLDLIEDGILPQVRRTIDSLMIAWRNEQAELDELLRASISEVDQILDAVDTRREWLLARIELAYLAAEELP